MGWNPPIVCEQIELLQDAATGVCAVIAIHDTRRGPAFGGIRRAPYASAEDAVADACRLAEAMSYKCAITGVPGGGGKAVVLDSPDLDRAAAYELVGRHVALLRGRYYTGPDVGTSAADLDMVARHTEFVATRDGPGDLAEPTAEGVLAGIEAVSRRLERPLEDLVVAIQGVGAVGGYLARKLHAQGVELHVADVDHARARALAEELDANCVPSDRILGVRCDVFAPCALGQVVTVDVARALPARAVAGSANNVLAEPAAGEALHRRGVLYAPDFAINSGALIHGALFHLQGMAPPVERVRSLGTILDEVFARSLAEDRPPETVALARAHEVLAATSPSRYLGS